MGDTPHIEGGLAAIPIARLDRDDVAKWIEALAGDGRLSRRSVQICHTVLRAALAEAVDEGLLPRNPAARVGLSRTVAKPDKVKEIDAWETHEVTRFLDASRDHRWAIGFRLGVLYGLRRSEVLALRWDDLDTAAKTLRVDQSLVPSTGEPHGATPRTSDHTDVSPRRRNPPGPRPPASRAGHRTPPRRGKVG